MYQLGNTRFEGLRGFDSLETTREAEYKEHALLGAKPALQRTGEKLDTLSISIRLHASFCVPEDEIDALEKSRRVGYILGLYAATGRYFGDFLIKSIRQSVTANLPDGRLWEVSLDIELLEYYYKDRAAAARRMARATAFASAATAIPFPQTPATTVSPGVATVSRLAQMAGTTLRIATALRDAAANSSRRTYLLREAARQAGNLSQQHGALVALLSNSENPNAATTSTLYALAGGSYAGAGLGFLASRLQAEANAGNLDAATATAAALSTEQTQIRAAAMEIATNTAVGRKAL